MKIILDEIDKTLGIENYTLAETNVYGEPTINLSYEPEIISKEEITTIKRILEEALGEKVVVRKDTYYKNKFGKVVPRIGIGGALSKARVKLGW